MLTSMYICTLIQRVPVLRNILLPSLGRGEKQFSSLQDWFLKYEIQYLAVKNCLKLFRKQGGSCLVLLLPPADFTTHQLSSWMNYSPLIFGHRHFHATQISYPPNALLCELSPLQRVIQQYFRKVMDYCRIMHEWCSHCCLRPWRLNSFQVLFLAYFDVIACDLYMLIFSRL